MWCLPGTYGCDWPFDDKEGINDDRFGSGLDGGVKLAPKSACGTLDFSRATYEDKSDELLSLVEIIRASKGSIHFSILTLVGISGGLTKAGRTRFNPPNGVLLTIIPISESGRFGSNPGPLIGNNTDGSDLCDNNGKM